MLHVSPKNYAIFGIILYEYMGVCLPVSLYVDMLMRALLKIEIKIKTKKMMWSVCLFFFCKIFRKLSIRYRTNLWFWLFFFALAHQLLINCFVMMLRRCALNHITQFDYKFHFTLIRLNLVLLLWLLLYIVDIVYRLRVFTSIGHLKKKNLKFFFSILFSDFSFSFNFIKKNSLICYRISNAQKAKQHHNTKHNKNSQKKTLNDWWSLVN